MNCHICGKQIEVPTKYQRAKFRKDGRVFCSLMCSGKYRSALSSLVMAKTNKKYASERMKKKNPMRDPAARERMISTLKRIGHRPVQRGGNGQLTRHQKALASALGWPTEYAIPTCGASGAPHSYKVDIACPEAMLAIEVDGHSHTLSSRQIEDQKKEAILSALGWKVLRLWNQEIDEDLSACVARCRAAGGIAS